VSVERGTSALLTRRRLILSKGAEPVGWKIGFNLPEFQQKLGIDAPLAGFLTSNGLLEDQAEWSIGSEGEVVVESEVAVELGEDARSIAALRPAIELADPPDLEQDVETILAGNIFHRAVAFGPRVERASPGAARILVNGEVQHEVDAERAGANLERMVEAASARLEAAGERLQPGETIITGVLAPPHKAGPGDTLRLELEAVGAVELRFAD
jgi:2-keto-4-pentenoate hydratase